MRNRIDKFVALFCIGSLVLNILSFSQTANAAPPATPTGADQGIRKIKFEVPKGHISLHLPDDIRAGDTISGTVAAVSTVDSASLSGYVFEAEGNKPTTAPKGILTFAVPQTGAISIAIKDSIGSQIGRAVVPVRPSLTNMPASFDLPTMGQTSRPFEITGPFDGNASNTSCTIGGQPAPIIAESPRQAIFTSPATTIGAGQIILTDADRKQSGPFRNVGVDLRAPKTSLTRGETTTLTVQVSGLQGISQNVPLSLNCTGAVNMQGGNLQQVKIQPNQVQQNGDATLTRNLTGVTTGNFDVTATVAVPISNLSGEVVHVEGSPNGGAGLWQVKIKLPGGKLVGIYIRRDQKPDLKFCDWIKIDDVTSENGTLYVGGYKKVPNPTKPPVKPPDPPKPPTEVKPPTTTRPPDIATPPPCKEGATRNISSEKKTFEVIDETGTPIFKLYTDKDGAGDAAANMADFWRGIAEAGGLLDYLPEGTGAGAAAAGWLFEYLDKGADILDALAKGKLKNTGVSKVTAEVIISTKKITATCITYEVCINGVWVRKKRLEQSEERAIFRAQKTAEKGGDEWDKVSDPSRPQFFDPERAEAWARDFFKEQANILKGSGEGYADFVKNCK